MPGAPKTNDELKQAIVLRQAGYSLASISERTGISVSTLVRHFSKHKIDKGSLSTEAVEQARQRLLNDAGLVDRLKHEIAAAVVDDISHVKQLRAAAALLLEELMADTSLPAHYKTRGLAALSTSLRLTQDAARKALGSDKLEPDPSELPTLTITELTAAEIESMRTEKNNDGVFCEVMDDIEVIEENG